MQHSIQRKFRSSFLAHRLCARAWPLLVLASACEKSPSQVSVVDAKPSSPVVRRGDSTGAEASSRRSEGVLLTSHQQTPTTRHYMLTHYADAVGMRRALVWGKLDDYHTSAAAVASDSWTPRLRGDYRPHVEMVRAAAHSGETASSIAAGAAALGKLGEACVSCHLKFGGPGSPVAPEQLTEGTDPSMVAHAVATDRLWEGLALPSDNSWSSGMEVLVDAAWLNSDVEEVAAAARRLRELAHRGEGAEVAQRGEVFASVLTTCAGCHERLGVVPRPAPAP